MKTRAARTICDLLAALSIILAAGCEDRQASSSQPTQAGNTKQDSAINTLEAKVGMLFPTNTVLMNSTDGGGRDPSYGFYAWAVFSPSPIKMPIIQAPYIKGYLDKPLADSVEFVEGMMPKQKISQPQAAYGSRWETNGFEFRGTLVRSVKGDYLVIEQFRKK